LVCAAPKNGIHTNSLHTAMQVVGYSRVMKSPSAKAKPAPLNKATPTTNYQYSKYRYRERLASNPGLTHPDFISVTSRFVSKVAR